MAPAPRAPVAPRPKGLYRLTPPPANFSPPVAQVDQPDYDWGSVLQGTPVQHSYVFKNVGGSPLVIQQVRPGCGCTTAGKPEKPIEPGQSDVVTLLIDTKRFSGAVKKTADVYTNSFPNPVKLSIGGKVDTFYLLEPTAPRIEAVRGEPTPSAKAVLKKTANVDFTVKEVKTTGKVIAANLTTVQPGQLYEINLQAALGEDPRKYFYETVTAKLDVGGKDFDVSIPVSVSVKERIEIQPRPALYFSKDETKTLSAVTPTPAVKTLDIKSLAGPNHTFNIVKVESSSQYLDVKVETVAPGKHYKLVGSIVKLPPASDKVRTLREKFTVATDDATVKEISVQVTAALQ